MEKLEKVIQRWKDLLEWQRPILEDWVQVQVEQTVEYLEQLKVMVENKNFQLMVAQERWRQDKKWGQQEHDAFIWLAILGEEFGELQKAVLEVAFPDYYLRLLKQPETELIQVAAVAQAMWESGKRNSWL